jgi:hypothetical protein
MPASPRPRRPSKTVSGNTTQTGAGGGVEVTNGGELYVDNSSITGNTSQGGSGGGLSVDIANTSGSAYITDSKITYNTAVDSGGGSYGGGVYLDGGAYVEITGSTISHNQATSPNGLSWGGGISVSGSDIYLTDSTVASNSADYAGGIMHWGGTAVLGISLTNSHVDSNVATFDGGGILNEAANGGADLWLSGTSVTANTAQQGNGGGIDNLGENGYTARLTASGGCSFSGNHALSGNGGAIDNSVDGSGGQALVTFGNTSIGPRPHVSNDGNKAQYGGGISDDGANGTASITFQSSVRIYDNTASVDGGGVYLTNGATLHGFALIPAHNHPDDVS